jgi:hypothetical protein
VQDRGDARDRAPSLISALFNRRRSRRALRYFFASPGRDSHGTSGSWARATRPYFDKLSMHTLSIFLLLALALGVVGRGTTLRPGPSKGAVARHASGAFRDDT